MTDISKLASDPAFNKPNGHAEDKDPIIIKAVGVGGGGNNAVNHMFNQGIQNVSFVVCNTDMQALKHSPVTTKVLLGPTVTCGLGAGNDPDKARAAAEESVDDINRIFEDGTKMVFITAGMGGGTGTGAAPVVARLAKEKGLLTVGIVTIPFLFEGEKKILKALDGADEMAKHVDALLVINNERLTEIYSDLDFINAFGKADDTLSLAAKSIAEIITCDGHINLDFNDVNTTLRNGGAAIISSGYGEGEQRVTKAIQDALNSPLLKNRDIYGSKKLLFNLYFSRNAQNAFRMAEAQELNEFMSNLDPTVDVIWGVSFDDSLGEKVKITILASGFDVTIREEESREMGSDRIQRRSEITFNPGAAKPSAETNRGRIEDEYGKSMDDVNSKQIRTKYVVLAPNQLDDDSVIDQLERTPAYNRDRSVSESIRSTSVNPINPGRPATPNSDNIIDFA